MSLAPKSPTLVIRDIRAVGVEVPMSYALGTSRGTITKAPLGVTANSTNRSYGATNPVFTASYSGFVNNETTGVLVGAPSLTTTATTNSPTNTYAITAAVGGLSATNYFFNFTNGTLTVGQATLLVTAADQSRAYGATNPVLIAGVNWAGDLSQWLANAPKDPLKQIAAVWHAYPAYGSTFGTAAYTLPGGGAGAYANAQSILSAGIPVVISESGDKNTAGTASAPFESKLLPWADQAGASYLGWAWDIWQDASNVLIKDAAGTPTDGYGAYFKQHLLCAAAGTTCR